MEDEILVDEKNYSAGKKFGLEILDMLQGVAFSLILMAVLSLTVIVNTAYDDLAISLLALIGGEVMLGSALIIFGRENGSIAYRKTVENARKRELGSKDEKVIYKTGEYAVWKGIVIGLIMCIPFIVFQSVELLYPNTVCEFCLKYLCGWAYFPFSFLGEKYAPLSYILILFPVAFHTLGYYLGKLKQLKIQEQLAKTNPDDKRSRVVDIPGEKKKGGKNDKGRKK
ncbi:MAG: hypothetical protein ACI4MS_06965 [Candidatus Coproplasma sp.]